MTVAGTVRVTKPPLGMEFFVTIENWYVASSAEIGEAGVTEALEVNSALFTCVLMSFTLLLSIYSIAY